MGLAATIPTRPSTGQDRAPRGGGCWWCHHPGSGRRASTTIPGHRRGAPLGPVSAFPAPKAKRWGRGEFLSPTPPPVIFITISGGRKGNFGSSQVCWGGLVPPGSSHPPGTRGKGRSAARAAELIKIFEAAPLFFPFSAPICGAERATLSPRPSLFHETPQNGDFWWRGGWGGTEDTSQRVGGASRRHLPTGGDTIHMAAARAAVAASPGARGN